MILNILGMPASGKSTLCKNLNKSLGKKVVEEEVKGNFFIKLFYNHDNIFGRNPWCFAMQCRFLNSYADQLRNNHEHSFIWDGGIFLGQAYVRTQAELKLILPEEKDAYMRMFFDYLSLYEKILGCPITQAIQNIFIVVPPEVSWERMLKRAKDTNDRKFEKNINFEYIKLLHEKMEGVFSFRSSIKVDGTLSESDLTESILQKIRDKEGGD